jgi:hypothetical protein
MPDDSMLQWKQASHFGIRIDEAANAWHAGHVSDIVEFDEDSYFFAVATETGGVWMVNSDTGNQIQLSSTWDCPDITCLASGPDSSQHLFAGCTDKYRQDLAQAVPVVMESQPNQGLLQAWVPTTSLPSDAGQITRIAVVRNQRFIVVSTRRVRPADRPGVFWARIPQPQQGAGAPPRDPYLWKRAQVEGLPADGVNDVAIASTTGITPLGGLEDLNEIRVVAGGQSGGIFVGGWVAGALVMERARQVSGEAGEVDVDPALLESAGATSLSSCDAQPNVVFAACARSDGRLLQVVRSVDGGQSWQLCSTNIRGSDLFGSLLVWPGGQGTGWNNSIAVAPYDPNLVALGWQGGPFISQDGGQSWEDQPRSPHLHSDLHALLFSKKTTAGNRTLYVGSDGGMASIDLDRYWSGAQDAFRSDYNRQMPTLQCYARLIRQFSGGMDASRVRPGLVSVGLQDNGNVYADLDAGTGEWLPHHGGDGGSNTFLSDDALLHGIMGQPLLTATFSQPPVVRSEQPIEITKPATPGGVVGAVTDNVIQPGHRNEAGQLLSAVAGVANNVFGLYIDEAAEPRYHWELLAMLPPGVEVSAVCSYRGGTVFAGTSGTGRMFSVDTRQGSVLELQVQLPKTAPGVIMGGGSFIRMAAFSESDVFAILVGASEQGLPVGQVAKSASYVVRYENLRWLPTLSAGLPDEFMYGLAAVPPAERGAPRALVVSTDGAVYLSRDDGNTWARASAGLPRRPHCGELRAVAIPGKKIDLYLGTYGRSVFRARFGIADA